MYDSRPDTMAHIQRVRELFDEAGARLQERARVHDASKLEEPEKSGFDNAPSLKTIAFDSPQYAEQLALLNETLAHHYAHNSHHPQHYGNGVDGMSLFDLLEMFLDWKAAGERHPDGDIRNSIKVNTERFALSDQLVSIFYNTVEEMGW